jgi:hypothetical protein
MQEFIYTPFSELKKQENYFNYNEGLLFAKERKECP